MYYTHTRKDNQQKGHVSHL